MDDRLAEWSEALRHHREELAEQESRYAPFAQCLSSPETVTMCQDCESPTVMGNIKCPRCRRAEADRWVAMEQARWKREEKQKEHDQHD